MYKGQFFESFSIIEDIREQGKVRHKLIDIIFAAKNDTKKYPKESMKGKRFIASLDTAYRDY
jgi:hypothetical protein